MLINAAATRPDEPQPRKSSSTWRAEIKLDYKAGKYANHRLSRKLYEAKTDLVPYGEWTRLWEGGERLFSVRKADRLAFVGEHVTSLLPPDRAEVCLPVALTTLEVLAHLPPHVLLKLIDDGRIDRKLKTKDANALLAEYNPQALLKPAPLNVRRIVAKIMRQLRSMKSQATAEEGTWALGKLQHLMQKEARLAVLRNPVQAEAALDNAA